MTNSDTLEPADLLLIGLPFMNDAWAKYPNDREHMKQAFKASEGYKQALTALTEREERIKKEAVAEAQANWSIMGKKPEEVYTILRALEFERIADIKVTMSNLDAISKLIQEDLRNANQRAINRVFEQFKTPELTKNTNSRKGK